MATYISLVRFTDKGIQAAKQTSSEWRTGAPRSSRGA